MLLNGEIEIFLQFQSAAISVIAVVNNGFCSSDTAYRLVGDLNMPDNHMLGISFNTTKPISSHYEQL